MKYREQMENELVSATQEVNSKEAQLQAQLEMLSALQRDCSRQKDVIDQLMEENNVRFPLCVSSLICSLISAEAESAAVNSGKVRQINGIQSEGKIDHSR